MAAAPSHETAPWLLENGTYKVLTKETRHHGHGNSHHGRTAHNMSSSSLRKKSDLKLVSRVRCRLLRSFLANIQEVILGTKLSVLFPAVPLAIIANYCNFGRPWIFALSLLALTPLAERVSFLTEYATLIVQFCFQQFRQADVSMLMLFLGLLCHLLPLLFRFAAEDNTPLTTVAATLQLSRASSIVMLIGYIVYIVFQLWTHRQLFEAVEVEEDDDRVEEEETAVIGFWSGFAWLVGMTIVIALLSEYVVATIEDASNSWGLSVSFISIILLPIVGNAAEHAGAIIFAFKDKLDISLGVALGSSCQISLFVIPLCVIVAWIAGIDMDLNFNLVETGSLAIAIITTAFTLQDGTSNYLKGLILLLCYIVIGACFFVTTSPLSKRSLPSFSSLSRLDFVHLTNPVMNDSNNLKLFLQTKGIP
ncbi:Vacuolar cation/proton exchanger 3 [Linum perenne]